MNEDFCPIAVPRSRGGKKPGALLDSAYDAFIAQLRARLAGALLALPLLFSRRLESALARH